MKKSRKKSKNVLEESKNGQAKNLHKKDQHVYNNCYELCSRAINKINFIQLIFILLIVYLHVKKCH